MYRPDSGFTLSVFSVASVVSSISVLGAEIELDTEWGGAIITWVPSGKTHKHVLPVSHGTVVRWLAVTGREAFKEAKCSDVRIWQG